MANYYINKYNRARVARMHRPEQLTRGDRTTPATRWRLSLTAATFVNKEGLLTQKQPCKAAD